MTNMFDTVLKSRQRKHVSNIDTEEHVTYNDSQDAQIEQDMTTATHAAVKVADFKQYTTKGKSTAELKRRIALFLAKLVQATTPESVKYLCEEEKSWFLDKYTASATRNTYMTAYRHAIQACFTDRPIPEGLLSERQTVKGLVTQHLAMNYMLAPAEDYQAVAQSTKTKTAEQRDHLTAFDLAAAIEATEAALQSEDWRELAAGLLFCVQSRPSDMLKTGDFKAVSKYQVEFTSKAKKRGSSVKGNVWTLVESATFIDAFNRLRRTPDVLELKAKTLTEVDSGKNSTLNRAIGRIFGEVIPAPYGEKELSAKNLRAAGVNVTYHLYGREDQSIGRFAELQLLHDSPSTAANYEDYYCTGANGKRVNEVGIRQDAPLKVQPKSRTTKRPMLDEQIVEQLHELFPDESTTKDCIIQAIASAKQSEQRQAEIERLQRRLQSAEDRIEALKTQTYLELIHIYPDNQKPAAEVYDPRSIPNAELIGSKKQGASDERLRRTIEAIQEYNAGLPLSEQIAINKGSLRKIAKGNVQAVNQYVDDHAEELDAYASAQGHSYRQNVGKDLSVIKWSEEAYGAYEWPEGYF